MNLSLDSSNSDSDDPVKTGREALPEKINFYILKTGKSKGMLITHNRTFKFTKNNMSRTGPRVEAEEGWHGLECGGLSTQPSNDGWSVLEGCLLGRHPGVNFEAKADSN